MQLSGRELTWFGMCQTSGSVPTQQQRRGPETLSECAQADFLFPRQRQPWFTQHSCCVQYCAPIDEEGRGWMSTHFVQILPSLLSGS